MSQKGGKSHEKKKSKNRFGGENIAYLDQPLRETRKPVGLFCEVFRAFGFLFRLLRTSYIEHQVQVRIFVIVCRFIRVFVILSRGTFASGFRQLDLFDSSKAASA